MGFRVVLVRPEGAENIGLVARAMANFGFQELVLVQPNARHKEAGARSRAMHALRILESARVAETLKDAVRGADFIVGTTARAGALGMRRIAISAREFAGRFAGISAEVALVFGPEGNGLSNRELEECDFAVCIPSSGKYRALNLSHAAAVLLYEIYSQRSRSGAAHGKPLTGAARSKSKERLVGRFMELAGVSSGVKNKKGVVAAFRALVCRAPVTEAEAKAVLAVFSRALSALRKKKA